MQSLAQSLKWIVGIAIAGGAIWFASDSLFHTEDGSAAPSASNTETSAEKASILEISAQARKNLGLVSKPAQLQSYWRSVLIPGEIADRPGLTDRGVTSPAVGVITAIHAFPGDTMRAGESLFTLRLFSEYLQNTQSELFKATKETELLREQVARLSAAARSGAVPESRLIELENQLRRESTLIQAYRQDLLTRGLNPEQIQQVSGGSFVSTIELTAPPAIENVSDANAESARVVQQASLITSSSAETEFAYEVQELAVELGQQVQAGQLLANLSNHQSLYVVGHAFKREAPFLEEAAQHRRPIDIEFAEDVDRRWPQLEQAFEIRHLSNAIDTDSRTFDFFIQLANQSRSYEKDGETFLVWRFRPGQRARLHVPVEKYDNVFVLPSGAVVHEGPEAYVFRQNGGLFKRFPVHVLHEDRRSVVIANDGSVLPGSYLAQSGAASLNRVLKAQSASGEQPGVHVHADGTVHAAH
jgi:cobalt-zinc-cadmium efflux system membrane fusion protein